MDKICRGSAIGEAHRSGAWDVGSQCDTSRTARGNSITTHSLKLDNTSPRPKNPNGRSGFVSDTFRSQEWFRHDGNKDQGPGHFSPRFWKGANALSPAPSAERLGGRSKSQKDLNQAQEENVNIEQRGHFGPRSPRSPRSPRGVARSRSEGTFIKASDAFAQQKIPTTLDDYSETSYSRAHSPRDARAVMSPRDALFGSDETNGEYHPRPRSPSPTYVTSEAWMGYNSDPVVDSAPDGSKDPVPPPPSMPSRNFDRSTKLTRLHSGRVSEQSDSWLPPRGDLAGEPSPPPIILNAVNGENVKGKKTNIVKDSDNAKRRLRLDKSQPDFRRSQKKHDFPTDPQGQRQLEEMRTLSPRLFSPVPSNPPESDGGSKGSRATAPTQDPRVIDVQHRTSAEMAHSMMPDTTRRERAEQQAPSELSERKYLVGHQLVNWSVGRRGASNCFQQICEVAAQATEEAGGHVMGPPMTALRDHRNSDVLREHLKSPQPVAVRPPRQEQPQSTVVTPVYSYGDMSSLPSTMPKDTAYLHSGLKVVKFGPRTPGYFSPLMARIPAQQAMG